MRSAPRELNTAFIDAGQLRQPITRSKRLVTLECFKSTRQPRYLSIPGREEQDHSSTARAKTDGPTTGPRNRPRTGRGDSGDM